MNFYDYMLVAIFSLAIAFSIPLQGTLGGLLFMCVAMLMLSGWLIACKVIKELEK